MRAMGLVLFAFWGLLCSTANADLIRFNVTVENDLGATPLGFMQFDVPGPQTLQRDIWWALTDWHLQWQGVTFDSGNSIASNASQFEVDLGALSVVDDGGDIIIPGSALQCALYGLCPYLDAAPRFIRLDTGAELEFSGYNDFNLPFISEELVFAITYSAQRVANVPISSTLALVLPTFLILVTRRLSRNIRTP